MIAKPGSLLVLKKETYCSLLTHRHNGFTGKYFAASCHALLYSTEVSHTKYGNIQTVTLILDCQLYVVLCYEDEFRLYFEVIGYV